MSRMKSEDAIGAKARPFTGAEYLASLRDGREVYIYGERVADVTEHPAFRNTARSIARLYDALHDPKTRPVLTSRDRHRLGRLTLINTFGSRARARTWSPSATRSLPGHA